MTGHTCMTRSGYGSSGMASSTPSASRSISYRTVPSSCEVTVAKPRALGPLYAAAMDATL